MNICFLLGAGFSYNAGLPLVRDVSNKFLKRPLHEQTLFFGSGEWKWVDWANDAELHNGRIHPLGLEISMFIELMVDKYLADSGKEILNYEEFYHFLFTVRYETPERFDEFLTEAQIRYEETFQVADTVFTDIPDYEIFSCFYHLVDDLLWVRMNREELYSRYQVYTDFLAREDIQANIYTLNHDLLVETLLEHWGIDYDDGFSAENKRLVNDEGNGLPVFNGEFDQRIKLLKLHGSIDLYQYRYIRDDNRHKGYDYFKTLDFNAKHKANDLGENGQVIQNFTPQIIPRFITGQNKLEIIQEDKMYNQLYSLFEENLKHADRLVIVGYSFADEHINTVLKSALENISEVIHIDPYAVFPYEHKNYRRINPITENVVL